VVVGLTSNCQPCLLDPPVKKKADPRVNRRGCNRRRPEEERIVTMSTLHYEDTQAEVHKVVVGPFENNVFVLRCKQTGDAVLLDAANEHERLLDLCRALGVRSVIETHGHWDHIQAVPAVRDAGYRVAVTADDAAMLPSYDDILDDESVVEVGRLRLHTILTPGHTAGSMCFRVEGSPLLFSGDTLFPGGPGNTEGDADRFATIIDQIDRKLFTLPTDTIVLPGHGADTTIGTERPHLAEWAERGW
jgi:glyoxylase-like metal-dependent hydrolase (beta-lactamase superfamily II)